jgi:hypothetical protein
MQMTVLSHQGHMICEIFTPIPEFKLKKQMCSSWSFHVDDNSESSSTYDMIMGINRDFLGELGIIMIFNDHSIIWDTDTIPMKDRGIKLYHQ